MLKSRRYTLSTSWSLSSPSPSSSSSYYRSQLQRKCHCQRKAGQWCCRWTETYGRCWTCQGQDPCQLPERRLWNVYGQDEWTESQGVPNGIRVREMQHRDVVKQGDHDEGKKQ